MRIIVISIAIIAQGVASLACFTSNLHNYMIYMLYSPSCIPKHHLYYLYSPARGSYLGVEIKRSLLCVQTS